MTGIGQRYEERERKAVADAVMLTKAEDMVNSVDRVAVNGTTSIEEACRLLGITKDAYDIAKKYIEEHTEKKEPMAV